MKQYTKPLRITRLENHTNESLTSNRDGKAAKRGTAGGLSIGTLTNTQILTDTWTEAHDRFLDNAFNEWELWLAQTEYRLAHLKNKYRSPFPLTDFPEAYPD